MSCHCAPGLGGIIWRRMTNKPEMPRDNRAGVMSNQKHSAINQTTNSNRTEPAQNARQQWRPKGAWAAGTHARNIGHPATPLNDRHSTRPIANVRSFSDVRSIKLTARMISTMIAPISW